MSTGDESREVVAIRPSQRIDNVEGDDGELLKVWEEDAQEDVSEAKKRIRKMLDPKLPTQDEIDLHMLSHLPYRNWCEHCVKGRGKEMDHKRAVEQRNTIEFHMDFCFPGAEDEKETLTILVIRERRTRMTMASVVPSKSMGMFIAKRGVAFMKEVGCQFGTVIVKSDQEPAMKAIVQEMCRLRAADGEKALMEHEVVIKKAIEGKKQEEEVEALFGDFSEDEGDGKADDKNPDGLVTRSVTEASPVGSSASNGVVERGIQSIEQQMRVMRDALEARCRVKIPAKSCLWAWMAEYAAVVLNRLEIGHDGKTAYERTKGKSAKHYGFEFGEKLLWKRKSSTGALGKLSCLWSTGIFLGVKSMTGEFIIGDEHGVWKTRTLHRKPVEERWDAEDLRKVTGVPWKNSSEDPEADGEDLPEIIKLMDDDEAQRHQDEAIKDAVPRSFAIKKEDLIKYGYTSGCPGCKAVLRATARQGHTAACRRRLEKDMAAEVKVKTAVDKENEFLEKVIEADEKKREAEKVDVELEEGKKRKVEEEEEEEDGPKRKRRGRAEEGQSSSSSAGGEKRSREDAREREEIEDEVDKMIGNITTWKEIQKSCPGPHEEEEGEHEEWGRGEIITLDSLTGKVLKQELVDEARREEVEYIESIPVYEVVDLKASWEATGAKPKSCKWVDVNKGTDPLPNVRCRWVARDFKPRGERDREDLFADMPPLEAKRLLLRMTKIDDWKNGRKRIIKVLLIDVRKAHLNAVCEEDAFVEIPPESILYQEGKCGKLKRWLYGMRPAAQGWQKDYTAKLTGAGFVVGRASKVVFYHEEWGVRAVVHGDDFSFAGEEEDLLRVQALMESWYDVKIRGMMSEDRKDLQEMTLLNRSLVWKEDAIKWGADPKHVDQILENLNINDDSKPVVSPMVKDPKGEDGEEMPGDDDELDNEEGTKFRRTAARCNYLAQDRTDIQFAVKTICKEMSKPTQRALRRLKRLGRYLLGVRNTSFKYKQGHAVSHIDVYTDSDWAGDRINRKSTSGGMLCVGDGLIKSWSKSQTVIARSSGEAEFYALNRGLTEALGLRALARDMGYEFKIRVHVDSSAAKSMVSRSGLGKTRHIQVEYLWSQDVMKESFVQVRKIPGVINPADVCTKPLNRDEMRRLLERVNVQM